MIYDVNTLCALLLPRVRLNTFFATVTTKSQFYGCRMQKTLPNKSIETKSLSLEFGCLFQGDGCQKDSAKRILPMREFAKD